MATVAQPPQRPYAPPPGRPPRRGRPWLRIALIAVLVLVGICVVGVGVAFAELTRDLPSIAVLEDPNSLGFKTAQIFDRTGQLLWEINDPSGGKRNVVQLQDVSPNAIDATLAAEDVHFYDNPGFDPVATLRSAWIDVTGQGQTGASGITQQLVRNAVLDPNEAHQTTLRRKLREIILSVEVDRHYSKDQVLEMYLNRVYYGNQSYGIETAAEDYFGVSAHDLDLAQASLLAGLVQAPAQYDPTRTDV